MVASRLWFLCQAQVPPLHLSSTALSSSCLAALLSATLGVSGSSEMLLVSCPNLSTVGWKAGEQKANLLSGPRPPLCPTPPLPRLWPRPLDWPCPSPVLGSTVKDARHPARCTPVERCCHTWGHPHPRPSPASPMCSGPGNKRDGGQLAPLCLFFSTSPHPRKLGKETEAGGH